ncbi:hypothetical protein EWM64_g8298 [Hericium alpestre]|uniref:Protein CPL1-like domain-containing protein n=1 Tax=Hericium alpestre TaxID=135208 RepID=A0A4Y9ZLI1_9AGAM|nr:hypothetical protein EWM64_g8298 [Hericium alpestre]
MKRSSEQLPLAALSAELCPASLSACPVGDDGFECVDFRTDLRSCGGCGAADPFTYDCSSIANADSVACAAGRCLVMSCMPGYSITASRDACVPSWA